MPHLETVLKTPDQANGCWSVEAAYCLRYAAGERHIISFVGCESSPISRNIVS